jgi:hypothetical protein
MITVPSFPAFEREHAAKATLIAAGHFGRTNPIGEGSRISAP